MFLQRVAETEKQTKFLEKIVEQTKAAESKLSFLESRGDAYSCIASDWHRHSAQMSEMVKNASTAQEIAVAKWERKQWRKSTFWMVYQQSAVRAMGFLVEEACKWQ